MSTASQTFAAQTRADLLSLADSMAQLATQVEDTTIEGAYTLALGYSQLCLDQLCKLKIKLERAAFEQRN
jgi:hypothetical protein